MEITNRESDVIELLAQGLTNKQIGKELGISNHTVRDHISSMLKKRKLPIALSWQYFEEK
ncbi:response regulator transcription factor [Pseudomonas trivialis]|uniref:response regulator transcription factor n=1 Tax=Pseudomonas trivialis TaxID=200450 RepID=UPI003BAE7A68